MKIFVFVVVDEKKTGAYSTKMFTMIYQAAKFLLKGDTK